MTLKIPSMNGNGSSPSLPASSLTEYLSPFVNVLEFLSSLSGPEGSKREVGSLSLTTKDGKWSIRVKAPTQKAYAYVTAAGLDECLELVERGLGDGSLDWRKDNDSWKARQGK